MPLDNRRHITLHKAIFNKERLLVLGILAFLIAPLSHADTLTGRVVGVSDGDTLTLLEESHDRHKIRLAGIDSPEKGQAYGRYCKQSLSDMTYDQVVTVEWNKRDRYGRIVGKVNVGQDDVNLEQINRGCGWHYKKYQHEQSSSDQIEYSKREKLAKDQGIGLWSDEMPTPPWEWRAKRNSN